MWLYLQKASLGSLNQQITHQSPSDLPSWHLFSLSLSVSQKVLWHFPFHSWRSELPKKKKKRKWKDINKLSVQLKNVSQPAHWGEKPELFIWYLKSNFLKARHPKLVCTDGALPVSAIMLRALQPLEQDSKFSAKFSQIKTSLHQEFL